MVAYQCAVDSEQLNEQAVWYRPRIYFFSDIFCPDHKPGNVFMFFCHVHGALGIKC